MNFTMEWEFEVEREMTIIERILYTLFFVEPDTLLYLNAPINCTHFVHQPAHKGSAMTCNSDADFYGYTECEWEVDTEGFSEEVAALIEAEATTQSEMITETMIASIKDAY